MGTRYFFVLQCWFFVKKMFTFAKDKHLIYNF